MLIRQASALRSENGSAGLSDEIRQSTRPPDPGAAEKRTLPKLLDNAETAAQTGDRGELREQLTTLNGVLFPQDLNEGSNDFSARRTRKPVLLQAAARLSQIGTICFEDLDYPNGIHAYLIGSRLVPDDPRFHYNLGLTWERLGDMNEAVVAFQKTLELDPQFAKALSHLRYAEAVLERLPSAE